jgi:hypothetical protein
LVGLVLGGAFLLLLALGGIGAAIYYAPHKGREIPDPEWLPFTPARGGFTVLMPGAPADKSSVTNGVSVTKFEVQHGGTNKVFSVGYLDLDPKKLPPNSLEVLTNAERDKIAGEMSGRVTGETAVAVGDVPGREFRIEAPDGSVLVSRVYVAGVRGGGPRVFQLVAAGRSLTPGQGDAARFLDSFRLDGPASPPKPPADAVAQAQPPAAKPPPPAPAPKPQPEPKPVPPGPTSTRPVWRETSDTNTVALAFSPDSATLAVGHYDKRLRLWDTAGSADRKVVPVDAGVGSVAFSKDGARLAVGGGNGQVMLWDPAAPKELKRFQVLHARDKDQTTAVALAFSPDGKLLAVGVVPGSGDGEVHLWDLEANKERAALPGCREHVQKLVFAADGALAVVLSTSVKVSDAATLKVRREFKAPRVEEQFVAAAVSPDGRALATLGNDKNLKLWDLSDGACRQTWPVKADVSRHGYFPLEFSPDGKLLALGAKGPNLYVWDAQTGKERKVTRLGESAGAIGLVTFSPDGKLLACAGTSGPWILDVAKLLGDRPE